MATRILHTGDWHLSETATIAGQIDSAKAAIKTQVEALTNDTLRGDLFTSVFKVGDADDVVLDKLKEKRSALIARTELASAWNGGAQVTMEQAEAAGAFSRPLVKSWRAQPGKPCPICAGLSVRSTPLRAPIDGSIELPPAHPGCRCVVLYLESA
jgi:hypothetical protein